MFEKDAEWLLNKALEPRIPYLPLDCEMGRLWNPSEGEALEARKAVRELEKRYLFRIICEDRETGETALRFGSNPIAPPIRPKGGVGRGERPFPFPRAGELFLVPRFILLNVII